MRRTNPIAARMAPIAVLTILAFVALSGGLAYWQILRAADLNARGDNPRVATAAQRDDRGRILDRNGAVLAHTGPGDPPMRVYTRPSLAHVLGYSSVRYGQTGIELSEHAYLSGERATDLIQFVWRELLNHRAAGDDVVLTIDGRLQDATVAALAGRTGAAVAIDPRNGEVLAMVSNPAFDPNRIDAAGEALRADTGRPLLNRATQGRYPPGSTFKTVTAAAALETDAVRLDTPFSCHDAIFIDGFRIACANVPQGEGDYDFAYGYVHSINTVFALTGVHLGWGPLRDYAGRFGFGTDLDLEIASSASTLGDSDSKVALAVTAFGQGELLVTPLQMAVVAATIANGGQTPQPHVVLRIVDTDGRTVLERKPEPRGRTISQHTAALVRDLMVRQVREAGGAGAAVPGVVVSGKTGTAETGRPGEAAHAWFIGFAPADNPRVAVAVLAENAGFGGTIAAPIAGRIILAALGG